MTPVATGNSQHCFLPPPTPMPSPAPQDFPPSTTPSSSSPGRNSQLQPRPKLSMSAGLGQPCCALPSFHSAMAVPSSFVDNDTRTFLLQIQECTLMCSATQRSGWLLVGAGANLSQPKALSPQAVCHLLEVAKWPSRRGSRGRHGESRDDLTSTGDKEKGINSAPASTKAGGGTGGDLKVAAQASALINNSVYWAVSTAEEGHFHLSRENGSQGWEDTSGQDESPARCWELGRLVHSPTGKH